MKRNNTGSALGITEKAFHSLLWIFLSVGIIGNAFVVLWRCFRKDSRFSLLSALIVSLAVADLLWCCHFLLQESALVSVVFTDVDHERNHTLTFTPVDERLCLASIFMFFTSCNAAVLTAVGIAVYAFCTLRGHRHDHALAFFIAVCWLSSLAVASSATWNLKQFLDNETSHPFVLSPEELSLRITYGCMGDENMMLFPVIATSLNGGSSVVCGVLYGLVCHTLLRNDVRVNTPSAKYLQIRLTVIVVLNVVCWWPACIIYLYSYIGKDNVFNGKLSPEVPEPTLLLTVAVSATNPLIYTIVSEPFLKLARRVCALCCSRQNEERAQLLHAEQGENRDGSTVGCFASCNSLFRVHGNSGRDRITVPVESAETEESSLFPESRLQIN